MRWGLTTGTCAALAAKAAAILLLTGNSQNDVAVTLPDGGVITHPVHNLRWHEGGACAEVLKDAGDDPDVTHEAWLQVLVRLNGLNHDRFFAGPGVGTVTRPGLAIKPGEAAINPGPRELISASLREVTEAGFDVTVSVPGGEELAQKTFNPRLGIVGGISILGTTGRVRPFSAPALRAALKCTLDVAMAAHLDALVLVPGNMGNKAAQKHFGVAEELVVDVSNEWGYMLGEVEKLSLSRLLIFGHPGKLAKLPAGHWQTHSSESPSPLPELLETCRELGFPVAGGEELNTVEELFMEHLSARQREQLGNANAEQVRAAVVDRFPQLPDPAVVLINLKGELLGVAGPLTQWCDKRADGLAC